jgi:hypothetical protein
MRPKKLGLRWTVGKVSPLGFEALRLSVWSAWNLFGEFAEYAICVNTIAVSSAKSKTGQLPSGVKWCDATNRVPEWLMAHVDKKMAEGVAWKFAPVRLFRNAYEISLDNDVILWDVPRAMTSWLASNDQEACLLAQDVQRCLGQFSEVYDSPAINSGIRGVPPGFHLERKLRETLRAGQVILSSELDEQGLQAAALSGSKLFLVSTQDVSIYSPFPMHQHELGDCGAHFVGLNAEWLPWWLDGRWAHEAVRESWLKCGDELNARVWGNRRQEVGTYSSEPDRASYAAE